MSKLLMNHRQRKAEARRSKKAKELVRLSGHVPSQSRIIFTADVLRDLDHLEVVA